jgi:serine/threonine-protein kinase
MIRTWSSSPRHAELETLLELGEGGMARAYLARALGAGGFQRLVVIKRLNLQLLGVPDAVERFLAEARVAARIHHANVVGTQQVGRDAAGPFIVLDYIEGGSLDDLISESELPVPVVLRIALDALSGLQAVHEAIDVDGRPLAILHRDISLQNILVSALDGVARLSDFGVAKSALGRVKTDEGVLVGKLIYFPPEYLRREIVGPPLDLYALGVTLWLALAREEPWHGASDAQVIREILDNGFPPLEGYAKVPAPIAEFVMRACERDPARRFQTAREMAEALRRFEREPGFVASHAEVSKVVSDVLGPALQLRRNAISRLTHSTQTADSIMKRIASLPTVAAASGARRLDAAPRPAALLATRRLEPVARRIEPRAPERAPRRAVVVRAIAAVALSGVVLALIWAISSESVTDSSPAAVLDVTVVHAPENSDERTRQREKVGESALGLAKSAPVEGDSGPPAHADAERSLPAVEARERKQNGRATLSRETSPAQSSIRKQNPYRRGSTE